jgi:hypothetical protein
LSASFWWLKAETGIRKEGYKTKEYPKQSEKAINTNKLKSLIAIGY